jgi:hypothetical protein
MDRKENGACNNSSIAARTFVVAVTFYRAVAWQWAGIHILGTQYSWDGFMKYIVEMGLGAMIYISIFLKTGLTIQKLIGKIHKTQCGYRISLLLFFRIRKVS